MTAKWVAMEWVPELPQEAQIVTTLPPTLSAGLQYKKEGHKGRHEGDNDS
ncbi:hypothetical protein TUM22923_16100 [Polynucleobacter sp. TUM22923]|nr:hypothetical protein TUM22923_16100 [Polynucleobacter sp. TUM22923]